MDNPDESHVPLNQCRCGVMLPDDCLSCWMCGESLCGECLITVNGDICHVRCHELARDKAYEKQCNERIA